LPQQRATISDSEATPLIIPTAPIIPPLPILFITEACQITPTTPTIPIAPISPLLLIPFITEAYQTTPITPITPTEPTSPLLLLLLSSLSPQLPSSVSQELSNPITIPTTLITLTPPASMKLLVKPSTFVPSSGNSDLLSEVLFIFI